MGLVLSFTQEGSDRLRAAAKRRKSSREALQGCHQNQREAKLQRARHAGIDRAPQRTAQQERTLATQVTQTTASAYRKTQSRCSKFQRYRRTSGTISKTRCAHFAVGPAVPSFETSAEWCFFIGFVRHLVIDGAFSILLDEIQPFLPWNSPFTTTPGFRCPWTHSGGHSNSNGGQHPHVLEFEWHKSGYSSREIIMLARKNLILRFFLPLFVCLPDFHLTVCLVTLSFKWQSLKYLISCNGNESWVNQ